MKQEPNSADAAATTPQPSTEQIGEDTRYCRQILRNMMEIGNELVAMLAEQALAQRDNPEAAQKSVAAYSRVTQSVRRTIMLHEKLGKTRQSPANRTAARKRIIRDVEDAIDSKADSEQAEALHAEFLERLDSPDTEYDIANRPITEIVTDICRDLGLGMTALPDTHPWKRRTLHDIAILNARAAQLPGQAPSAELAALLATAPPTPPRRGAKPPHLDEAGPEEDLEALKRRIKRYTTAELIERINVLKRQKSGNSAT